MSGSIEVTVDAGIATITLNQPERRNAMTLAMWQRLGEVAERLDRDPGARVLVVRGAGADAFSAGADISEFAELRSTPEKALLYNRRVSRTFELLTGAQKPLIALIHGFCVGGGCELSLTCDLRIAASDAVFGLPAARLGISVNYEDVKRLVDAVGPSNARLMLFTGDPRIPAQRAFQMGLVDELVAASALEARTYELADQVIRCAPSSIRWAKQAVSLVLRDPSLSTVPDRDEQAAQLFGTDDFQEGIAAFLEKRQPDFNRR
jgi:enoyl-CoA hydratase/carnithine racemase